MAVALAATIVLVVAVLAPAGARAQVAIDLSQSILNVNGALTTETGAALAVPGAVGPFILDYDGDGILEADTNGNGFDRWDPELRDYSAPPNGTLDLPPGATFTSGTGTLRFTALDVPGDAFIEATGPLRIEVAGDVAIDGAVRVPAALEIAATGPIAVGGVLRAAGDVTLRTAVAGAVAPGLVAGGCSALPVEKGPFPAVSPAGLALLAAAMLLSTWIVVRRRRGVVVATAHAPRPDAGPPGPPG